MAKTERSFPFTEELNLNFSRTTWRREAMQFDGIPSNVTRREGLCAWLQKTRAIANNTSPQNVFHKVPCLAGFLPRRFQHWVALRTGVRLSQAKKFDVRSVE